jgi:hypothetical protein
MIDAVDIVRELLPALNACDVSDLVFWSEEDLYRYADEAAKQLARTAGVFAADASPSFTSGENALPTGAIAAVHVFAGSSLRPATVRELEALDATWKTTTGTPARFVQDIGLGQMRLYPAPASPISGKLIYHAEPATVTTGSTEIADAPSQASFYFAWGVLSRARSAEGEAQMTDVAAHFQERATLFETVAAAY